MMKGVNSNMPYLIYYKNICKCHNVSSPSRTINFFKRLYRVGKGEKPIY
jgi:hypothetical protein